MKRRPHLAQSSFVVEDDSGPGDGPELGRVGSQLSAADRPGQVTEEQRQRLSGGHHLAESRYRLRETVHDVLFL